MKQKILIIEDDKDISKMLFDFLSLKGFAAACAHNGVEGFKEAAGGTYNLVLLDLMLPYKSGDTLLQELREVSDVPVIVMSAKGLTQTKIELLRLGADDYVTKPFDLDELLARIESNLKRYDKAPNLKSSPLTFGEITLDSNTKNVTVNGAEILLTATEYMLLELMLASPQKVFSKQNLYETIWKEPYAYDDNTINTHISNLRKKLKEYSPVEYIETVWGMGYKLIKL